jgi:hypothetical protein
MLNVRQKKASKKLKKEVPNEDASIDLFNTPSAEEEKKAEESEDKTAE